MKKMLIFGWIVFLSFNLFPKGKEEITIGFIGDLSGRGSELWVHARNGIELALKEYNENPQKIQVELLVIDDQGIDEIAFQRVESMRAQGISIFFGPTTSGKATALSYFYEQEDLLFLSATASTDALSGLNDSFIRSSGTSFQQGSQLMDVALEYEEDRNFYIIRDLSNESYTRLVVQGFSERAQERGATILGISEYNTVEEQPFEELARQATSLNPQGILLAANDLDSAALIQQMHKINPDLHYYAPSWADTPSFIVNAGRGGEGAYLMGTYDIQSQSPEYLKFKEAYIERYGIEPIFTSARYYEMAQVFFDALIQQESSNPQAIKEHILTTAFYHGLMGDFIIDPYGDTTRDYIIIKVINGQGVAIP